jgi:chitinase
MPAICQNVQIWHNNAALSSWHTQGDWAGWFTYDLGASKSREGRGGQRGDKMCPDSWKRTIFNPRCPETNQPRVVPPLYYLNGIGVTALVPRSIPGETELRMIIADGKDDPRPFVGQLQSSGRKYTCDEFHQHPGSKVALALGVPAFQAQHTALPGLSNAAMTPTPEDQSKPGRALFTVSWVGILKLNWS